VSKKRGNGEGSIAKRKDGRWMARYTVQTAKGPKRKHIYGRTRQEVAEKLSKARTGSEDWSLMATTKRWKLTSGCGSTKSCAAL
jgi:hypothetical protein